MVARTSHNAHHTASLRRFEPSDSTVEAQGQPNPGECTTRKRQSHEHASTYDSFRQQLFLQRISPLAAKPATDSCRSVPLKSQLPAGRLPFGFLNLTHSLMQVRVLSQFDLMY
jgi:hypothetical protein